MKTQLFIKFTIVMLFFSSIANSQAWLKNLPANKSKGELTLFDYKNAFNAYWAPFKVDKGYYYENGVKTKAAGWKQFKRWEYAMEGLVDPATGKFPSKTAQQVYEEYLIDNPQPPSLQSANWLNLGTNSSYGGYSGIGRVNCIAFHPTDVNTYWVGTAAGGLWVTNDNGASWTCLTDNNGVLAVSDIIIPTDYATSNTIYIATGDKDAWNNNSIGVLKSTNSGLTWNVTGLSFAISDWKMVNRILLDPADNQTIIAATTNGVYKTTNGGTSWSNQLTANSFIDMEYKPGDFNTLYGSTQNGEIFVTTNGGTVWTNSFIDPNAQRIELAVSANQPDWIYALAATNTLYGVYKSVNSGGAFVQVFDGVTSNLLGYDADGTDTGGQGSYSLSLEVSPFDANNLFVGGVNTWGSVNGGTSWTLLNHWYGGGGVPSVHADKHNLKYQSNGVLFECNDGGIYASTDNGISWTDKTNGLVISQMYKLGVSKTVSTEIITGLQDNGSKLLSAGAWFDVKGGDGLECLIDYTDVNIQYGSYVNGQITRTTDHWVNDFTDIEPTAAGSGAWVTPYIIDPVDPQTLYAGYADVWKTTDRGTNWTMIYNTMNSIGLIRSMAIAPSNNQVLYVAGNFIIRKTADGGASWNDITGTLPVSFGFIKSIAVKNDDPNTLWVTLSGYNATKVYQSVDGGISWTDISAGLPQIPVYSIVQNKQSTTEVHLYVGTELGIYFKQGTNNWVAYNTNLPNVKIGEIEIYYDLNPQDSKLRAATFGRGLWESSVYYSSVPMVFTSSTTTQNDTANVAPNQINQGIIGVEIVTNGNLAPLSATSFTFNTSGSTNPTTDITNAKLFYTGTTNTIATTAQFGTTSNAPNGTFTITGTQLLSAGTNYFWLTYDVPLTATISNVLDAQCTSFTVSSVQTPSVQNPLGNREIDTTSCAAAGLQCDEYISNVTFGTINNSSICSTGGYASYSSLATNMAQGSSLFIAITNGLLTFPNDQCGIWVDWNSNGDFLDDLPVTVNGSPGVGPYSATINCPINASLGLKRLRARIHYNNETTSPCGNTAYGEVEEYSINVTAFTSIPPVAGTAASSSVICFQDLTAMTLTGYTGNIQWQQSPNGSSSWTNVSGGTGANAATYTTGNLSSTIYYRAEVSQPGFSQVYSNVITVTVVPTPTITLNSNTNVLTTNQTGSSYQWINCGNANTPIAGATSQSYSPTANGNYAVILSVSGCSDTSDCSLVSTIGIDEIKNSSEFIVYPSPATDFITITVNANLIGKSYFITDGAGKLVLTGKLTSEKSIVRVNELASGVYIIKILNRSKKLVK